jgi:adenylate kinase
MKVVMLLGPPGSGKGTVAERLRGRQGGYVHFATGDMLREEVSLGTAVGRDAESYMKRGELVPDAVIIRIVEKRLEGVDPEASVLFDGFPRTLAQADLLDRSLAARGSEIDVVFFLATPREVIIQRLTGRRVCRECGASFHIVNIPPKVKGICDACGGELYQRKDDNEETIANRLDVYNRQTESLISRYENKGLLARLDSDQGVESLMVEIERKLQSIASA